MSVSNKMKDRGKILDAIMLHHREQLPKTMREVSFENVRAFAAVAPAVRDFYAALQPLGVSVIAECKKASPSKGLIAPRYDAVRLAQAYEQGGASAISVLTDTRHFQGTLQDLRDVRQKVKIPVLRKDFIFHPYQIYEARSAGADAILLIAAVLEGGDMGELLALTHQLGMNALVEVHTEAELTRVLALEPRPRIIGINNRNLQTFVVDFENTARLRQVVPPDVLVVGESGLKTGMDVRAMRDGGVDAILVGETFVKSKDVYSKVREFVLAGRVRP